MIPDFSACDAPISHKRKGMGKRARTAKTEKKKFERAQGGKDDTQSNQTLEEWKSDQVESGKAKR